MYPISKSKSEMHVPLSSQGKPNNSFILRKKKVGFKEETVSAKEVMQRSKSIELVPISNDQTLEDQNETIIPHSALKRPLLPMEQHSVFSLLSRGLDRVIRGEFMEKTNRHCREQTRFFQVSLDRTELRWGKSENRISSSIFLSDVKAVFFGPRTQRFRFFDWKEGLPWLCFSVVTLERSLDIRCADKDQIFAWVMVLQRLVPTKKNAYSRGRLNWETAMYKIVQKALVHNMHAIDVWHSMVYDARIALRVENDQNAVVTERLSNIS